MNGSRLGRGRVGRLAVYVGSMVVVALLVFLYRTATTEMSRLRELHVQCVHQQEALGAQLQVIFEYKSRLEKSLAEEKKSNTEIKQELEKRADREKSLRDKNSIEAMQKFNSLQQHQKILQVEHQDLKDECEKTQKLALEEKDRLESRLQDLRSQIREKDKIREDKDKMKDANDRSLEHLKSKYLELETEKRKIEGKYNDLMKSTGNADGRVEHLNEEIIQLKRDVEEAKASCRASSPSFISDNPKTLQQMIQPSADQQISPSRQQNNAETSLTKFASENSTKSTTNSTSTESDKSSISVLAKSVSRIKLPMGVVPIPQMIDQTDERNKEELKQADSDVNSLGNNRHGELKDPERPKSLDNEIPEVRADNVRHLGAQILNRGFQEIGDEPNHFVQMPGFEEAGGRQGVDDQYEYYRDAGQKNDINLEENEEEEDEDEDDQIEYRNNGKLEKHK